MEVRVYCVDDLLEKVACLPPLVAILNGLCVERGVSEWLQFVDGHEEFWNLEYGRLSPAWYLENRGDQTVMKNFQDKIYRVLAGTDEEPGILDRILDETPAVWLLDIKLEEVSGAELGNVHKRLKEASRPKELQFAEKLFDAFAKTGTDLAATLASICCHRSIPCLTISYEKQGRFLRRLKKLLDENRLGKFVVTDTEFPVNYEDYSNKAGASEEESTKKILKIVESELVKVGKQMLKLVLKRYNLVYWFLHPPGSQRYKDLQWFAADADTKGHFTDCHNASGSGLIGREETCFEKHLNALRERIPGWVLEKDKAPGPLAKALVHSRGFRRKHGREPVSVSRLKAFFDSTERGVALELHGFNQDDDIIFPQEPAFPFLMAVYNFLSKVSPEGPFVLKRINESSFFLGTEPQGGYGPFKILKSLIIELSRRGEESAGQSEENAQDRSEESGELGGLFVNALWAEVLNHDEPDLSLAKLLKESPSLVAVPWAEQKVIGVAWKAP